MAELKRDSTSQQKSCQSSPEDVANELHEKKQVGVSGDGRGVLKFPDSSSREDSSSPSQPSPSKTSQTPNPNPTVCSPNARPYFSSAFGGNPFTLLSSFPASHSELRMAPSKFPSSVSSGSGLNTSPLPSTKPVLRPSQLLGATSSFGSPSTPPISPFQAKSAYSLNPSKFGNPFAKVNAESKVDECLEKEEMQPKEKGGGDVNAKKSSESVNIVAPKFVPLGKKESGSVERTDLGQSTPTPAPAAVSLQTSSHPSTSPESVGQTSFVGMVSHSTISASASTGFVFGQNLHERVEASANETCNAGSSFAVNGVNSSSNDPESKAQTAASVSFGASMEGKCEEGASTNGDSEMLFSSVLKREPNLDRLSNDGGETGHSKSLSEAAREYEESRAVKRKYEEVTIITGEEEEDNVLQITCKLFAFNIEKSSWVERGRGQLRVNDKSDPEKQRKKQSRLVMRTQGSLRVVLNTKIWAGMSVVRASPKSIRMTAMDDNQIRVFLIMASPADTERLINILLTRVELQKQLEEASKAGKESDGTDSVGGDCSIEVPSPAKKVCEERQKAGEEILRRTSGCATEEDDKDSKMSPNDDENASRTADVGRITT